MEADHCGYCGDLYEVGDKFNGFCSELCKAKDLDAVDWEPKEEQE